MKKPFPPSAAPSPRQTAPVNRTNAAWPGGSVIFIGASTGGTDAIRTVLAGLPAACPPVLIVQHMPEMFTGSFARRLDGLSAPQVVEAQDQEPVRAGTVYIAPGHSHMEIRPAGTGYSIALLQTPLVNRHRPAVDVLFHSAAAAVGAAAVGVILTGMGKDGARGLLAMHQAGARTLAQDEKTCVVFGMPREAIAIGAADEIVPLEKMAERLIAGWRGRPA
jgi:two-component system, chemotaxis family, protein-glutamate methylesterase/glutaminase